MKNKKNEEMDYLIKAEKISFSFPNKELYKDISFTIQEGTHAAFIGSNGTGKSTLVTMITDPEEYMFDGRLKIKKDCRIGYVKQFFIEDKNCDKTVMEYLSEPFIQIQKKIDDICEKMSLSADYENLMEEYQRLFDISTAMNCDSFESDIKKYLKLADIAQLTDQPVNLLSGGEYKLVQIMREMFLAPDILIMDEPDAFLDFERLNGLRKMINAYRGALFVITHNRYLLNQCFNKIIHLENMMLQEYDGNFTEYNYTLLKTKAELMEMSVKDAKEIERNKAMVQKMTKDAEKFNNASLGRTLQARKSLLERLEARRVKAPFVEIRRPEISFMTDYDDYQVDEAIEDNLIDGNSLEDNLSKDCQSEAKEPIVSVNNLFIEFERPLLSDVSFEICKGDKVAIVGENGTGKSTLLSKIYENKTEGIQVKSDLRTAFLSQFYGDFSEETEKVSDVMLRCGFDTENQMKQYLSEYCFENDILDSRINQLSGGEKNLFKIAMTAACNTDLLLLDEPTSHLDTYSQVELERALDEYKGTIIMVSHDFYSIVNSMDYVLFIDNLGVRKIRMRKFRKMIYDKYFEKDYLLYDQKKQQYETMVKESLKKSDYEKADLLLSEFEQFILSR